MISSIVVDLVSSIPTTADSSIRNHELNNNNIVTTHLVLYTE